VFGVELREECKARLREITSGAIIKVEVQNGNLLRVGTLELFEDADAALPKGIRKTLAKYISERPFSTFVFGFLQDRLLQQFRYEEVPSKQLSSLNGYEDTDSISTIIVEAFVSLPWRYIYIYSLPLKAAYLDGEPERDCEYLVTKDLSFVRVGPLFRKSFSLGSLLPIEQMLVSNRPRIWNSNKLYLRHSVDGYISNSFDTQTVKTARLRLRSIGGLLKASGYATASRGHTQVSGDGWIYVYKEEEGKYISLHSHRLEADYAQGFRSLKWSDSPR
jgi:hypothetical protein